MTQPTAYDLLAQHHTRAYDIEAADTWADLVSNVNGENHPMTQAARKDTAALPQPRPVPNMTEQERHNAKDKATRNLKAAVARKDTRTQTIMRRIIEHVSA